MNIPVLITTPSFSKTVELSPKAMTAVMNILHSGAERKSGYHLRYKIGISDFVVNNAPPKAVDYIVKVYQEGFFN